MARVVVHEEVVDEIDTEPVMRKVAEAIAEDARIGAEKGRTLGLSSGISVTEVTDTHAVIESHAENPRSSPEHAEYPYFVEKGTGRSRARPYMRPAAYRYRSL
jgi:hypothetical protein